MSNLLTDKGARQERVEKYRKVCSAYLTRKIFVKRFHTRKGCPRQGQPEIACFVLQRLVNQSSELKYLMRKHHRPRASRDHSAWSCYYTSQREGERTQSASG
mmetsp:Transcript_60685/g.94346  ORF Transcript_60685/g.94346 Transcript_60685/m.94346 type:complete len:102 (+) Transcript_60685:158-463(+)